MKNGHRLVGRQGLEAFEQFPRGAEWLSGDGMERRCGRGGATAQQEDLMTTAGQVIGQVGPQGAGGVVGQSAHRIQRFHGRACGHDATHEREP